MAPRWQLWLQWMLATSMTGTVAGVVPTLLVSRLSDSAFVGDNLLYPVLIWGPAVTILAGLGLGLSQALIMRSYLLHEKWLAWLGVSMLGVVLGLVALICANFAVSPGPPVGFVLPGAFLGFSQWLVLRRYIPDAGWWILGSAVAWSLGLATGWLVLGMMGSDCLPFYPPDAAISWSLAWALTMRVFGCITGLFLSWLVHRGSRNDLGNRAVR